MDDPLDPGVRASGVLLHVTSLPGPGIGDMGPEAYRFVDWLVSAGQSYWQILPVVPTDGGGSPYNGLSALAGNALLVSPALLVRDGLLKDGDVAGGAGLPADRLDYPAVLKWKTTILRRVHGTFASGHARQLAEPLDEFRAAHRVWLADYALFRAIRDHLGGVPWTYWPEDLRVRDPVAMHRWRTRLGEEVERYEIQEYLFDRQWRALRDYANERGVRIIGDLPIFVAHDSADVWANQAIFRLDPDGVPDVVAGVPPDYFSETGQRWGNPLYRWDVLRARGYDWWVQRLRRTLAMVDLVRVDHFRGFESYWEIPANEETAVFGRWVKGPGAPFFRALQDQLGPLPLIAEDLGLITREVEELRDDMGFPGMRVLQFAFDGDPANPHLPVNHVPNSIAYTGTHDNETIVGWWAGLPREERARVEEWLGATEPGAWTFIEAVLDSAAALAVVPLQDVLGLGSDARMNTPGQTTTNWTWRLDPSAPMSEAAAALLAATVRSGRAPAGRPGG